MLRKIILVLMLCASTAWAQKAPIKMIVPFSPGGQVDLVTREVEQIITQELKRTVVVEYKTGAGASIGIGGVARTTTNEVVLMAIDTNALANVIVSDNLSQSSFRYIGLLGSTATGLAVIKGSPFRNLKYWQTVNRPINVGTNGIGSPHHYYNYLLGNSMNLPLVAVPYKGIPQSLSDLLNGSIDAMWGSVATLLPYEQAGKIEIIANLNSTRLPYAQDIPTFSELGFNKVVAPTHWMLISNATADPETVQQIQALFAKIVVNREHDLFIKTKIQSEANKYSQAENVLQKRIKQQQEFAEIIKQSKIKD